ncbi:MAG: hypothetical protein J0L78_05625 [Planctomycetes bacterium]|nr:hypothetical protein [Planctomycetota bacterium]
MAISRERKIYAAVLLVGGAALAIDRGFLGVSGPKQVHAAELPTAEVTSRAPRIAASTVTLADRLKQLGEVPRTIDLLETTLQRAAPEVEIAAPAAPAPTEDLRESFAASHHLSAVASTAKGSNALVNGRAVSVGESIGAFILVEVTRDGAVFTGPGGRVELHLPKSR